jgi:hypothetical protein
MRVQPKENNLHEIQLRELRIERNSEDHRLRVLKSRLEKEFPQRKRILSATHSNGRVNAA